VPLGERHVVHFKPGKELRELVDNDAPLVDNDD
jgi:nucleoid DNA-binding protein